MLVSVITVTYNRSRFIPALIECYRNQLYKHTEWLILDDSDPDEQVINEALCSSVPSAQYIHNPVRKPMGHKLNQLTAMCKGDLIVVMDDDDYYPPTRISSVVDAFQKHPDIQIAGCSKVYLQFVEEDAIYSAGPYHDQHAIHCTIAYRSSYLKDHRYDDEEPCGVEKVLTNNFTEPMIQLDPRQTILHMVHQSNTFQGKRTIARLRKTTYTRDQILAMTSIPQST